jgi:hypothetical protein
MARQQVKMARAKIVSRGNKMKAGNGDDDAAGGEVD